MPQHRDDTLLRMRATDAGFDRELLALDDWLSFTAAGNLAIVWLRSDGQQHIVAASPASLVSEVSAIYGVMPWTGSLPYGASGAWICHSNPSLDALCRRIAVLGYVLPDQPLKQFEAEVEAALALDPTARATERFAEVRQRVGQDLYRFALMKYWHGRCALTGISEPILLRASHAKPWKDSTDVERLDVHNGLLLTVHLDAAFDAGLITVSEDSSIIPCRRLGEKERRVLGIGEIVLSSPLRDAHQPYFAWHRERIFLG